MSIHLWTIWRWIFTHGLAFLGAVLILQTAGWWRWGEKKILQTRKYVQSCSQVGYIPGLGVSKMWACLFLLSPFFGTMAAQGKVLVVVPLLSGTSKCPHMQACMYTHMPQTLTKGKEKENKILVLVSFHFCLFCQHYGLCLVSVLLMVLSGVLLLECLSYDHVLT